MRVAAALIIAIGIAVALTAFGGGREYRNEAMRIGSFEVPRDWVVASQVPYPKLLLVATSKAGARLVLAAQWVVPGTTAIGLAADARAALMKKGMGEPRVAQMAGEGDRCRLDATFEQDGARKLTRQVYVVDGDLQIVITVTAPADKPGNALRDFDKAVESLSILPFAIVSAGDMAGPHGDAGRDLSLTFPLEPGTHGP